MRISLALLKNSRLISLHSRSKQAKHKFNAKIYIYFITDVQSRPPEAHREAELQGSDVVPVSDRDEQHLSRL